MMCNLENVIKIENAVRNTQSKVHLKSTQLKHLNMYTVNDIGYIKRRGLSGKMLETE